MYLDRLYTNAISQSTGKGSIDRESACREFAEPLRCIGEPDQSAFLFQFIEWNLLLDTEEKREDVLMQLVAMQRLVEKAEYSPDLAFEYFGYSEQKRQLYKKVVDYMIDVSK